MQYLLLTSSILFTVSLAADQTVTIDDTASSFVECSSAGINDKCTIRCTVAQLGIVVDCGNAGECELHCDELQCLRESVIYANNSASLTVISNAGQCFQKATVNVPHSGDAFFAMTNLADRGFKELAINAGPNTQSIFVNCTSGSLDTSDECRHMTVHAATAQYVRVEVGANSMFDTSSATETRGLIDCPQNSNYQGPDVAPCIVDVSKGGTLIYTNFNTLRGVPKDFWMETGATSAVTNVRISCTALSTDIDTVSGALSASTLLNCWDTEAPTTDPTQSPSKDPTQSPTDNPSQSPTTANPSSSPSEHPSGSPSNSPSEDPSVSPTAVPSESPAKILVITPKPTSAPITIGGPASDAPTLSPVAVTASTSTSGDDLSFAGESGQQSSNSLLAVIISVFAAVVLLLVVILMVTCKKLKKQQSAPTVPTVATGGVVDFDAVARVQSVSSQSPRSQEMSSKPAMETDAEPHQAEKHRENSRSDGSESRDLYVPVQELQTARQPNVEAVEKDNRNEVAVPVTKGFMMEDPSESDEEEELPPITVTSEGPQNGANIPDAENSNDDSRRESEEELYVEMQPVTTDGN